MKFILIDLDHQYPSFTVEFHSSKYKKCDPWDLNSQLALIEKEI